MKTRKHVKKQNGGKKNRKAKLMQLLNNSYVRLAPSDTHGVGIRAVRDIPQGVFPMPGVSNPNTILLSKEEVATLHPTTQKMIDDFWIAENNGSYHVSEKGVNDLDIRFYINHSETPNVKEVNTGNNFHEFITLRPIKAGEELLLNYNNRFDLSD